MQQHTNNNCGTTKLHATHVCLAQAVLSSVIASVFHPSQPPLLVGDNTPVIIVAGAASAVTASSSHVAHPQQPRCNVRGMPSRRLQHESRTPRGGAQGYANWVWCIATFVGTRSHVDGVLAGLLLYYE